jgi:hypothetical protein
MQGLRAKYQDGLLQGLEVPENGRTALVTLGIADK